MKALAHADGGVSGSERIEARTVIWAAGVAGSPLGAELARGTGATLDRAGRVVVEPDLSLPGHPEIAVIGDLAAALSRGSGGAHPIVTGQYRLGDVRHITASSERIARELGWRAAVGFDEGMAEFATAPLRAAVSGS